MSLIVDRDLMVLEPSVFVDATSVGTLLASGTDGIVSASSLASAGVNFETRGVTENHVATVAGEVLEVLARPSTNTLTVSRPRMTANDDPVLPTSGSSLSFSVTTFERQIAEAQAWALGALGIDPQDTVKPLDETAVVNVDELDKIIALRTICDVFAMAAARLTSNQTLTQRRDLFRERLRRAVAQTSVLLDLNGDGVADASRRLNTIVLARS